MAGSLIDTITKHRFNFGPADPGGQRMVGVMGLITLRNAQADLTGGVTTNGSPIITGLTTTAYWRVGDYIIADKGFPTANIKIIAVAATTLTLDTNATSSETTVTVTQAAVQVLDLSDMIPALEKIIMDPNGGYVFDYDYTSKKFIVYVVNATPGAGDPLEALTTKDLGALTVKYIALGF